MKAVIMGVGYIGLPTAALMASKGFDVIGVDADLRVVEAVSKGDVSAVEPDLAPLVRQVVEQGRLRSAGRPESADFFVITVPTPFDEGFGPDVSHVMDAARQIAPFLKKGNTVVLESTVPVGTTRQMLRLFFRERPDLFEQNDMDSGDPESVSERQFQKNRIPRFFIAYCPERVLPGKIFHELEHNQRIIGGINPESTDKAAAFYASFVKGKLHKTDAETAEMCKLTENAYRDMNIAFANELSMLCDKIGIDVRRLIEMANQHPRVNVLEPGCGVGGHCIPVDPLFLISRFPDDTNLMQMARETNNSKTEWVLSKIRQAVREWEIVREAGKAALTDTAGNDEKPIIGIMGLTFKPDVDDLRGSPALYITRKLLEEGNRVLVSEPNISESYPGLQKLCPGICLVDRKKLLKKADIVVFLVRHRDFSGLSVPDRVVLDFCGVSRHPLEEN
ncbi:MAG: nucleotide sugar dehydrogenase [Acidobacteria bacterium]|nr:nucleotide sugar dehydrogenase [Acidobacteriota bacterium]